LKTVRSGEVKGKEDDAEKVKTNCFTVVIKVGAEEITMDKWQRYEIKRTINNITRGFVEGGSSSFRK